VFEQLGLDDVYVGHWSDFEGLTGCTVILAPQGVTASVDIRGGAPGTLETALLSPYASVRELHGVLLTGGSAPGLAAAAGVTAFLRERGFGYRTPYARIPLVAGAVIYDLGLGSATACPRPEDAYTAAVAAFEGPGGPVEGSVGAGTGATVGKVLGMAGAMKGGVGLARTTTGSGISVVALAVVNALGDVLAEDGTVLAGARRGGEFVGSSRELLSMPSPPVFNAVETTTLAAVMTDAALDKLECGIVARLCHDGLARAIDPVHTPVDGDAVFVLATGKVQGNVFQVGVAAAQVVAAAIRRAVRVAESKGGVPGLADFVASGPDGSM